MMDKLKSKANYNGAYDDTEGDGYQTKNKNAKTREINYNAV